MSALHLVRFRVPITIAAGVAGIALAIIAISQMLFPDLLRTHSGIVLVPLGLVVFGIAMRFDMSDTARRTRRTDIAFWLHLLAAPFIVHPVVQLIGCDREPDRRRRLAIARDVRRSSSVVALIVDRRALLVSSLAYLGLCRLRALSAMPAGRPRRACRGPIMVSSARACLSSQRRLAAAARALSAPLPATLRAPHSATGLHLKRP